MIAGLLEAADTNNTDQVPAIGSIPVLGRLFRLPEKESTQREIVISVTPELEDNGENDDTERIFAIDKALGQDHSGMTTPPERYAMQVQDHLAQGLRYPEGAKNFGTGGFVTLRLHIAQDGTLLHSLIAQSSGYSALDEEALAAAQRQAPYQPFPFEVAQQDIWLDLPVFFNPQ